MFLTYLKLFLNYYYEKAKKHKKIILFIFVALAFVLFTIKWCYDLVFIYPVNQVFQITNLTEKADLINKYRTTSVQLVAIIVQIFGGIAIFTGIYFAWKNLKVTQDNLNILQESQITECFTRDVDQLGNPVIEIRLGGIYALERIANESKKDYWPIMKILTAYVRKNANVYSKAQKTLLDIDIQTILTVIGKRKNYLNNGESNRLSLQMTCLQGAELNDAHFEGADLKGANLEEANLQNAHFEGANLRNANLEGTNLSRAHLEVADLCSTHLKKTDFNEAHLEKALILNANFEMANLSYAHLEGADLCRATL